jgi:hypothetical protein
MIDSLKSGQGFSGHWRNINSQGAGIYEGNTQMWGRQHFPAQSANGRMRRTFGRERMFPFRIYQLPEWFRSAPNPAVDWLKFCVRGGNVLYFDATGTDGYNADPYAEYFPTASGAGVGEVALTAGKQTWFWLSINLGTPAAVMQCGYSGQTVSGNTGDPIALGWTNFPDPNPGYLRIGYVDTLTNEATCVPIVRQYLFGDVCNLGTIC